MEMLFNPLPFELKLCILQYLDVPAIENLCSAVPSIAEIVSEKSELIYREMCICMGYTAECGSNDCGAKVSHRVSDHNPEHPSLEQSIAAQRTATHAYNDVDSWEKFAKAKHKIEENWETHPTNILIDSYCIPRTFVWRFKVDTDKHMLVRSNAHGEVIVEDLDKKIDDSSSVFKRITCVIRSFDNTFPHIEYSEGYLILTGHDGLFFCYRRADIPDPAPEIYGNPENHERPELINLPSDYPATGPDRSETKFDFHAIFNVGNLGGGKCLKARYPNLIVASAENETITIFDLPQKKIQDRFKYLTEDNLHQFDFRYIDFDSKYIFLAGEDEIKIFDRSKKSQISAIPPKFASTSEEEDERESPNWTAIHQDCQGGQLVAIGEDGFLLWIGNYEEYIHSKDPWNRCAIVKTNMKFDNICVDERRAVFSGLWNKGIHESMVISTLFSLQLHPWTTLDQFVHPKLQIINSFHYSTYAISRLEMDTCAVYATGLDHMLRDEECYVDIKNFAKTLTPSYYSTLLEWSWQDLMNISSNLCPFFVPPKENEIFEFKHSVKFKAPRMHPDSVIRYYLGPQ